MPTTTRPEASRTARRTSTHLTGMMLRRSLTHAYVTGVLTTIRSGSPARHSLRWAPVFGEVCDGNDTWCR